MSDSDSASEKSGGRRIKVARLLDKYEVDELGAELERRWTTSGEDHMSLRSLADFFNQRLLAKAMSQAGMQPLSGAVKNTYELLTSDDVSSADRTRARRRLKREGVDVEQLLSDFVTYQAIRTYLKEHRGAEHAKDNRDRTVIEAENIQKLRGRARTVTESKLEQLQQNDDITVGNFRLFVDINAYCEDCGQQYKVDEFLDRGGCDCPSSRDE